MEWSKNNANQWSIIAISILFAHINPIVTLHLFTSNLTLGQSVLILRVQLWTEGSLAMITENLGLNIASSWKQSSMRALTSPRVIVMVGPIERSLQALSGCVVAPPSATMWGAPGAFSKATVETEPSSECKLRRSGCLCEQSQPVFQRCGNNSQCLFRKVIILMGIIVCMVVLR